MKFIGFLATFIVMLFLTVVFLAAVDALPEPIGGGEEPVAQLPQWEPSSAASSAPELPTRVVAKDVGMDIVVLNPNSTDVAVLDKDLLKGAVRYPTSARLGVEGTVLLFGHSSYLPIVHNQNYKAFNNIQKLKEGNVVSVYAGEREYRYKVTGVRLADASEDVVELPKDGRYLTLVTCNTFAAKTARYVVTATLVAS